MEESPYRYQQGKSQISQQDVQGYNNSIHQNNRNINQFNSANINSSLISQNLNNSSQGYGSNYPQSISEQDENWSRYEGEYQSSQPFQPTLDEKYMQPLEKIQSNKWQLRKIGYQEIQQVFTGVHLQLGESDEVQDIPLEQYGPWLKNIISEKNFLALTEGLKAIEIFIDHYQGTLQNQIINYYLGDLIKKAPLFKPQQQQIALNIMNYTLLKGDAPFVAHEVAKQLESSNPKIVQFGLQIIKNALEYQLEIEETIFVDETMRILFHSNLALLKNTNKEIRSTAIENLKLIFIQCKESEKEIEKAFLGGQRSVHLKEIQDIFKKTQKKIMKFKLIQEGKNVENEKINKQVLNKGQKVDLLAVLPEKFFEIPYLLQPIQKKNKLEEMWQNIQKLIEKGVQTFTYKDGKDYSNIFNILVSCLEESNFLIFNEALKCVKNLMKLMRNGIPFPILKNFLTLIIDQFRGPKARQYNQAVWQALDDCFFNQCCSYEQLIDLMIVNCENEKNLNTRVGCINWLGGRFIPVSLEFVKDSIDLLDIDTQILSQKGEKLQKLIDCIDIKIEAISKKALNQILKEACQYLLMRKNNEYFNEYDKENSNTYNIHNLSTNQNQSNSSNNKKNYNSKQPQQLSKPPEPTKLDKQIKQPPQKIQAQPQSPVPPQKQQPQQQLKPSPSTEINLLDIGINDYQSEKAPDQRRNNPSPPIVTRKNRMEQQMAAEAQKMALNQSERSLSYKELESRELNMMRQLEEIKLQNNYHISHPTVHNNLQQSHFNQRNPNQKSGISNLNNNNNNNREFQPVLDQNINQSRISNIPSSLRISQNRNQSSESKSNLSYIQESKKGNILNCSSSLIIEDTDNTSRNDSASQRVAPHQNNKPLSFNHNQQYNSNSNNNSKIQSQKHSAHNSAIPHQYQQFEMINGQVNNNQMYDNIEQQLQYISVKNNFQGNNRNSNQQQYLADNANPISNDNSIVKSENQSSQDKKQLHKKNQLIQQQQQDNYFDGDSKFYDSVDNNHILNHSEEEREEGNQQYPSNTNYIHSTDKTEVKKNKNYHSKLESISPIINQFDQLSSNRHYYGAQEGKLNFSEINYTPTHPPLMHRQIQPSPFNEEPWLSKYQEEKENNQKIKQELDKACSLMSEKEREQSILKEQLDQERRSKIELENKLVQLQQQSVGLESTQQQQQQYQQKEEDLSDSEKQTDQEQSLSVQPYPQQKNGICLQEQYITSKQNNAINQPAKSPLELVPAKQQYEKIDCIRQLQEILLISESLYNDLGEDIIYHYERLEEIMDKIEFIIDLKLAVIDDILLENMSDNNFRVVFMIALRLCTSVSTQREIRIDKDQKIYKQSDLTQELQNFLDSLLSSKSIGVVLVSGIKILNSSVPNELDCVYTKNQKMLFRLILKCLEKMLENIQDEYEDLRVFEVLTEIYKFFKCHPPENLNESLPCLKDLEFIFRSLKTLSDKVVSSNIDKAQEFVEFIHNKHTKSIFVDYLVSLVSKITNAYQN